MRAVYVAQGYLHFQDVIDENSTKVLGLNLKYQGTQKSHLLPWSVSVISEPQD